MYCTDSLVSNHYYCIISFWYVVQCLLHCLSEILYGSKIFRMMRTFHFFDSFDTHEGMYCRCHESCFYSSIKLTTFEIRLIGLLTYLLVLSQNRPLDKLIGLDRPDIYVGQAKPFWKRLMIGKEVGIMLLYLQLRSSLGLASLGPIWSLSSHVLPSAGLIYKCILLISLHHFSFARFPIFGFPVPKLDKMKCFYNKINSFSGIGSSRRVSEVYFFCLFCSNHDFIRSNQGCFNQFKTAWFTFGLPNCSEPREYLTHFKGRS